jgi:hypothetical protein
MSFCIVPGPSKYSINGSYNCVVNVVVLLRVKNKKNAQLFSAPFSSLFPWAFLEKVRREYGVLRAFHLFLERAVTE